MADNYLEKQYESYQARKAAWEKAKKLGKKKQKPIRKANEDANEFDNAENESDQ